MSPSRWIMRMLVLVVCAVGVNVAYGSELPYESIKTLTRDRTTDSYQNAVRFTRELKATEILQVVRDAARENDRVLLETVVGEEFVRRVKNGEIRVGTILGEIDTSGSNPVYATVLFWGVTTACPTFSRIELEKVLAVSRTCIGTTDHGLLELRMAAVSLGNAAATELAARLGDLPADVESYGTQLVDVVRDHRENPKLRRLAVKGLAEADYREAVPVFLSLLRDEDTMTRAPLARSLCAAMARMNVREAIPAMTRVLRETDDEYVFATAAVALGQLGGDRALRALVENDDRFDGEYCGVGIRKMYPRILQMLASSDVEELKCAISATGHFYSEEQVAECKRMLIGLLRRTTDIEVVGMVLERLLQSVEEEEARAIVERVPSDPAYADAWLWLDGFARATRARALRTGKNVHFGTATSDPPDGYYNGNKDNQEYGDPAYRDLDFNFRAWYGHTGLCSGRNSSGTLRVIEVENGDDNVVHNNTFNRLKTLSTYWGAYNLWNYAMNFTARRNVVATAVTLLGLDIGYPGWGIPHDMMNLHSSPGSIVDPEDIKDLRCDGLTEYCYEYNGLDIWGKNGSNYDISAASNVDRHNDFFDWPYNPDEETSPIVQCGEDPYDGSSTYLGSRAFCRPADITNVTYDYVYDDVMGQFDVNLYITAKDESGIHYVAYKDTTDFAVPSGFNKSPRQPQHPNSSSYTAHFFFHPTASTYVFYYASDNGFYDTVPIEYSFLHLIVPTITLSVPVGGESWEVGSKQTISWSSEGDVGDVEIEYSTDGGSTWKRVITQTDNDGSFVWIVPNDTSNNCLVRITDVDGFPLDTSPSSFSIYGTRDVTLVDPNGGEILAADSTYAIAWTQQGAPPPGDVRIEYSIDEGDSWITIEGSIPNTLAYPWTVPNTPSTRCLVSVSRVGIDKWDASNNMFTITEAPWTAVESPNGGEEWPAGKKREIIWQASSIIANVRIDYSIDGGVTWLTIVSSTANDGLFRWSVPNTPSTFCKVRICDASETCGVTGASDTSDNVFTIVDEYGITILAPGLGDVLQGGLQELISWISTGLIDNVEIMFSSDDGFSWSVVESLTTNDGSYSWLVPELSSTTSKIRVRDYNSPAADESETFTVVGPPTGLEDVVPERFALYSNMPNPFNPSTVIRYDVPRGGGTVTLRIYDVTGRLVREFIDESGAPGRKHVVWDGRTARGEPATTGVYFYRLSASGFTETKKMLLLK